MKKLSFQLGVLGSSIGVVVGMIELSIGTQIRSWIGNKEKPFVLGMITIILSSMALLTFILYQKRDPQDNDRKLVIFLGVLLPTVICFTTVGKLWYLPGCLLVVALSLLAQDLFITPKTKLSSVVLATRSRLMAGTGGLVIIASTILAFWYRPFSMFHAEASFMANRFYYDILPMDLVYGTTISNDQILSTNVEVGYVMTIYILLLLGSAIAVLASLTASRLFMQIGGGIVFFSLLGSLLWLPRILEFINPPLSHASLLSSLGWGWYLSGLGSCLILFAGFSPQRAELTQRHSVH
jgi:hypothetical protein